VYIKSSAAITIKEHIALINKYCILNVLCIIIFFTLPFDSKEKAKIEKATPLQLKPNNLNISNNYEPLPKLFFSYY
jgi:hypothetical protein